MNSFSTAIRNIKKSVTDYSLYFFTLILGVTLFYSFNSIGAQGIMEKIASSNSSAAKSLVSIIDLISVGVACTLGLLLVYANNFLIKRRKKELGIYQLLGMSKRKVAKILSIETGIVGIVSLAVGLFFGIFASQLLSIFVAKSFEIDLTSYQFTVSGTTLIKTAIYFAIIFFIMLIRNASSLNRFALIDLLHAQKKAEKKLVKNPKISVLLFFVALISLAFGYIQIGFRGAHLSAATFSLAIVAGLIGTFLLFFSLSGFITEFLKSRKNMYYSGLNSFVVSQFGHNLNSSALSFALISLLLFLSICAFSVGFSMKSYLNNRLKNATPVDITAATYYGLASDILAENGIETDELLSSYFELPIYESPYFTIKSSVAAAFDKAQETFFYAKWDSPEHVMALSDYNRLEEAFGRKPLSLSATEYANISDFDLLADIINEAIQNGNTIPVGEISLSSAYPTCINEFLIMSGMSATMGVTVVPDEVIANHPKDFELIGSLLIGDYRTEAAEATFTNFFETALNADKALNYSTKIQTTDKSVGTSVSVVFIVLYIGIIFIITSAAVIALKLLSDSMDSVDKFKILSRIGADLNQRKKALFYQILLNFALPLLMGFTHSIFGLRYVGGLLKAVGLRKMFTGTSTAALIMLLVYGGYFLLTYLACKKYTITPKE